MIKSVRAAEHTGTCTFVLVKQKQVKRAPCGPVMKRCDVSRTIMMKSVRAGEYTAPPAHGPIITDSCVCVCGCVGVCVGV